MAATLFRILMLCVAITTLSTVTALGLSHPGKAIELYKQERARSATVTVQELERFVSLDRWTQEDRWEARVVVQAAGNSGKTEFRPVLKRAADSWSRAGRTNLTFYALHNLWKLGEPQDYFLENVRAHEGNTNLAWLSALVWGRDATEQSLVELTRIKDRTPTDSPVRNLAYPQVRGAVHLYYKQYAELRSTQAKVDMVLSHAGAGFNPIGGLGSDPLSVQSPEIYWARRELLALCKQDPELVARRVLAIDTSTSDAAKDYYLEYFEQFLDAKATAASRRMREELGTRK